MKLIACMFLLVSSLLMADEAVLNWGPMLGYADLTEAVVLCQTKQAATVELTYASEGQTAKTLQVQTNHEGYLIARFTLSGLAFNTNYTYSLSLNGQPLAFSYPLTFKTQAHWRWRSDPPPVTFVLGSCLYVNDPPMDRPGKGYGDRLEILNIMAQQKADFMMWLGDNVYFREPDFNIKSGLLYRYNHTRSFPALQPLLAAFPHYAIWDDHDYGPNDSNRAYPFKQEALNLFKAFWANPHYGMPDVPGNFSLVQWADLDFFLLDDRWYRAPNQMNDNAKPYLGKQQLQWLKDSLLTSIAPFKFIVTGNQVINPYTQHESYQAFPEEFADLMSWLQSEDIRGVIFLTGDRHFTELVKVERPGNYPLYEFTSSPISSGLINDLGSEQNHPLRVPGTLVNDLQNFGVISVAGERRDRILTMKTIDANGKLRWEQQIKATDLRRPKRR